MLPPTHIILVGRHAPSLGELTDRVVEQRNIVFPARASDCTPVIESLIADAAQKQAAVIFQALPPQGMAALLRLASSGAKVALGLVVSRPGPRPAGESRHWRFDSKSSAQLAAELARSINPNVRVSQAGDQVTTVTDPPMPFEFSHIEWLDLTADQTNA